MGTTLKPISKERAQELREALNRSRSTSEGLAVDRETGQCVGTTGLGGPDSERINAIGKFDTHYGA
ncbi:MAG: hypothetical protein KJ749_13065 [Planctomycetes bacterium]|nr:hypothetical protein [Planctomycetota bacterium]